MGGWAWEGVQNSYISLTIMRLYPLIVRQIHKDSYSYTSVSTHLNRGSITHTTYKYAVFTLFFLGGGGRIHTDVLIGAGSTCESRNAETGTGTGMSWKRSLHKNPAVNNNPS